MDRSDEILFVDKPKGITSFGVIRELRKRLGVKKIGHAGTLDPFATGLLIVGVGAGTKHMQEFEGMPKTYVMDVKFGMRTDSGDPDGKIIEEKPVGKIDKEELLRILDEMKGEITLPIPKYSAVKHKGIRLYKYARRGIEIEEKFRTTKIFYLKLLEMLPLAEHPSAKIEMKAEKGTYARAVAEEIGKRLGVPAMLQDLRRTKIGDIDIRQAKKIEEI
jgi:tRNA pseudouridine55 synthase